MATNIHPVQCVGSLTHCFHPAVIREALTTAVPLFKQTDRQRRQEGTGSVYCACYQDTTYRHSLGQTIPLADRGTDDRLVHVSKFKKPTCRSVLLRDFNWWRWSQCGNQFSVKSNSKQLSYIIIRKMMKECRLQQPPSCTCPGTSQGPVCGIVGRQET